MNKLLNKILIGSLLLGSTISYADEYWRISKTEWTPELEKKYEKFVEKIGSCVEDLYSQGKESTVHKCLDNKFYNEFRTQDPDGAKYYSDCADLPYFLRAYFSWKNGLPFGYVNGVTPVDPSESGDIRYNRSGNKPTGRRTVTAKAGKYPKGFDVIRAAGDDVSSAMFRNKPEMDDSKLFTDFYSVKISRDSIKAGTAIYDPNGHVAVVYKVTNDGRVLFIDAHPDNSLTKGSYGEKFVRSNPGMGSGFKNFRPIKLVGATKNQQGFFEGGSLQAPLNKDIKDYSTEQFYGTNPNSAGWSKGTFVFKGETLPYQKYVRAALAIGNLVYDPLVELKNMLTDICNDAVARTFSVQSARDNKIDSKAHPEKLPRNIYGTSGEWEEYSTPSRDARLKTSLKEAYDRTEEFLKLYDAHSASIVYTGEEPLKDALAKVFREASDACHINYLKSNGTPVDLGLDDLLDRVWRISFDPYHCVERRWGESEEEAALSCKESSDAKKWYVAEQNLRNQIERKYDARMDFTAAELLKGGPGTGVATTPKVDIRDLLY